MSRAHNRLAHRTVRYHSAVVPRSSSVRIGLMVPPPLPLLGIRVARSLDLEVLRRRFSAVAYDLELDLLAFVERGQTRLLHRRNVHKHIAPAALRLDESIAFGRIKPLHSPGRHQSSPGKRDRPPNLHIPVTAAIRIRHITNGLVTLIPANLRDRLSRSHKWLHDLLGVRLSYRETSQASFNRSVLGFVERGGTIPVTWNQTTIWMTSRRRAG